MERDIDLIRKILFKVESLNETVVNLPIEGYPQDVVNEHVYLCLQENLIEGYPEKDMYRKIAHTQIERLTWKGHEFIKLARNDGLWNKMKTAFKEKAISYSVEMVLMYLKQEAVHLVPHS